MQEKEVNILKLWDSIWGNRKLIIILCLSVAIVTAGISLILPKWYRAKASILPPSNDSGMLGALTGGLSSFGFGSLLGGGSDGTNRLLAIAKSRTLREMIVDKFNFMERYEAEFKDDALKTLGKKLVISTGRDDELTITFYDKDQEIVAEVVQFVVQKLDSLEIALSQNKAQENKAFIEGRVKEVTDSLFALQNEMLDYMESNDIISITDQVSAEIDQAAEIKAEIAAMEIELKTSQNLYDKDNLMIKQLEEKLTLTKENYHNMFFGTGEKLFLDLEKVPSYQLKYLTMEREMQYYVTLLEFLGPQYENAKIESNNNVSRIQVLDYPQRPDRRYKPRRAFLVVLATFVAFCISLFIIYIKSAINEAKQEDHSQA